MRVLLIALLAAISYAQTDLTDYSNSVGQIVRDGLTCNIYEWGAYEEGVSIYKCDSPDLCSTDGFYPNGNCPIARYTYSSGTSFTRCAEDFIADVNVPAENTDYFAFKAFGSRKFYCNVPVLTGSRGLDECQDTREGNWNGWQVYRIICPTHPPTQCPTSQPSKNPTSEPSKNPTLEPSKNPTSEPSKNPTSEPSKNPTSEPSKNPTFAPITGSGGQQTHSPTSEPSKNPTSEPSKNPTSEPSKNPTSEPSAIPTLAPTTGSGGQQESCKYPEDVCRIVKIFDDVRNNARASPRRRAKRFDGACKRINSVANGNNQFKHTEETCVVQNEATKRIWREMASLCHQGHTGIVGDRKPKTGSDLVPYWVRVQRKLRGCRETIGQHKGYVPAGNEECEVPPTSLLDMYDQHENQCLS